MDWTPQRHGFNAGLFVVKPASFDHGCHFPTVELGCYYGDYERAKELLRLCYGNTKDYPRITTIMLQICHDITGSDTVKPRLHGTVNAINTVVLRFCDGLYGYDTVWSANMNMSKIAKGKKQDSRSVTVDPGTSRLCLRTRDGYPTDNPGLKP